eukprot:1147157-Pelagomonas_calceolata.AAC.1
MMTITMNDDDDDDRTTAFKGLLQEKEHTTGAFPPLCSQHTRFAEQGKLNKHAALNEKLVEAWNNASAGL